jgi:hypothetical protein|tara:strand:+ start:2095 stop:2256 length:162 start_codon:yes stop_codon:yes gene_type:complete
MKDDNFKIRLSSRDRNNAILRAKKKIEKMTTKKTKELNDFILDKIMDDIESWR